MIKDMFYVKPGTPAQQADFTLLTTMLNDKRNKISVRYGMRGYSRIVIVDEKQALFLAVVVESTEDIVGIINKARGENAEYIVLINEATGKRTSVLTPVSSDNFA